MWLRNYRRKLRIWKSDYGRAFGGSIELFSKTVAVLTETRFEEMFWHSYHMEIVTNEESLRERLLSNDFGESNDWTDLAWRNREFHDCATCAFPATRPFIEPGRLMIRGLSLAIRDPLPWDHFVLWLLRSRRQ